MMPKKYYAVKNGRNPGIYHTWEECKKQVDGFPSAVYKSFKQLEEAKQYIDEGSFRPQLEEYDITAYVDGSYNVATKEFSYGMVILYDGQELKFSQKVEDEELAAMRNVAGEIKGAQAAMEFAIEKGCKSIQIFYDYEGIAKWCLGEWKTNKEGTKAYKQYYDSIKDQLLVRFVKVKGHSGDKYNDMADELAKEAIFIS